MSKKVFGVKGDGGFTLCLEDRGARHFDRMGITLSHLPPRPCPDWVVLTIPEYHPPPPNFSLPPGYLMSLAVPPTHLREAPALQYTPNGDGNTVRVNLIIPTLFFPVFGGVGFEVNGLAWWIRGNEYGSSPKWYDASVLKVRNQQCGWNPSQPVLDFIAEHMEEERIAKQELERLIPPEPIYLPCSYEGHTPQAIAAHLTSILDGAVRPEIVREHIRRIWPKNKGRKGQRIALNDAEMKRVVDSICNNSHEGKRKKSIWKQYKSTSFRQLDTKHEESI